MPAGSTSLHPLVHVVGKKVFPVVVLLLPAPPCPWGFIVILVSVGRGRLKVPPTALWSS